MLTHLWPKITVVTGLVCGEDCDKDWHTPHPLVMHAWGVEIVPVTTFEGKSFPSLSLATKSSYLDVLPI